MRYAVIGKKKILCVILSGNFNLKSLYLLNKKGMQIYISPIFI